MNLFDKLKNVYKVTQETLARRSSLDRSGASVIIYFSHAGLYSISYHLIFIIIK